MASPISPWRRGAFESSASQAIVSLIAFADEEVLGSASDLNLRGVVPHTAPVADLDVRMHAYADSPQWIDEWRSGGMRYLAARDLDGQLDRLDAAPYCYSVRIQLDDPADLTHLQLIWAVGSHLAESGCFAILDAAAANWHTGVAIASLSPLRPFNIQHEISLIAETEAVPGFGHPVHTRGMIKFGRPDLIAGVPAPRIEHTGQILNHLARMQADGHVLHPGQKLRFDGSPTLEVTAYRPDITIPNVELANDGLLLVAA